MKVFVCIHLDIMKERIGQKKSAGHSSKVCHFCFSFTLTSLQWYHWYSSTILDLMVSQVWNGGYNCVWV